MLSENNSVVLKTFVLIVVIFISWSCSKDSDSNPVESEVTATGFIRASVGGTSWYSNVITTSKTSTTRYLKASQTITNNSKYSSAIIEFWISVNQTGVFAIGEKDPGYSYSVRAAYTLKSISGTEDEIYKAYFQDYSYLRVNQISDINLDATFIFRAYTDDISKSITASEGVIKMDF